MYTFGYNGEVLYNDELELDELGNVCIEAIDNELMSYYLIIRTALGQASVLEYGPLVPDSSLLPDKTDIKFQRVEFSPAKIKKIISTFLMPRNKGRNKIVDVYQIEVSEALNRGTNILEYMRNFNETSNY